nr:hypothetical protein [Morchella crassipes]
MVNPISEVELISLVAVAGMWDYLRIIQKNTFVNSSKLKKGASKAAALSIAAPITLSFSERGRAAPPPSCIPPFPPSPLSSPPFRLLGRGGGGMKGGGNGGGRGGGDASPPPPRSSIDDGFIIYIDIYIW